MVSIYETILAFTQLVICLFLLAIVFFLWVLANRIVDLTPNRIITTSIATETSAEIELPVGSADPPLLDEIQERRISVSSFGDDRRRRYFRSRTTSNDRRSFFDFWPSPPNYSEVYPHRNEYFEVKSFHDLAFSDRQEAGICHLYILPNKRFGKNSIHTVLLGKDNRVLQYVVTSQIPSFHLALSYFYPDSLRRIWKNKKNINNVVGEESYIVMLLYKEEVSFHRNYSMMIWLPVTNIQEMIVGEIINFDLALQALNYIDSAETNVTWNSLPYHISLRLKIGMYGHLPIDITDPVLNGSYKKYEFARRIQLEYQKENLRPLKFTYNGDLPAFTNFKDVVNVLTNTEINNILWGERGGKHFKELIQIITCAVKKYVLYINDVEQDSEFKKFDPTYHRLVIVNTQRGLPQKYSSSFTSLLDRRAIDHKFMAGTKVMVIYDELKITSTLEQKKHPLYRHFSVIICNSKEIMKNPLGHLLLTSMTTEEAKEMRYSKPVVHKFTKLAIANI